MSAWITVHVLSTWFPHDGSLYDCLLDSMARVQSIDHKAVFFFVCAANAHYSGWQGSVFPTDPHGRDALDFCNLSGCESWSAVPLTLLVTDSIL